MVLQAGDKAFDIGAAAGACVSVTVCCVACSSPVGERLIGERRSARSLEAHRDMAARLRAAGHPVPALALAQEAKNLIAQRHVSVRFRSPQALDTLARQGLEVATLLCQLREPAESLRLAEEGRQCRRTPDVPFYLSQLSYAWQRIAKARWELKQEAAALTAFQEATNAQRRAFEMTPNVRAECIKLARCYEMSAYRLACRNDWARAAAAHLEREKLWLADGKELAKIARALEDLAEKMGKVHLTPGQAAEQQRYLAESERIRRAAEQISR